MSSNVEYRCATCHKSENEVSLLRCSRCKRERYCSRECQRANWREHKSDCSDDGCGSILEPFKAVLNGTWFSNCPKHEVFKLLIDVYKMKIEDEYVFDGDVDEDSVYGGASPGRAAQHFCKYLTLITKIDQKKAPQSRILPHWWSKEMITENVNYAKKDGWSFIGYAIEKSDVIDHYKNPLMPMQLRAMREQLEGPKFDM